MREFVFHAIFQLLMCADVCKRYRHTLSAKVWSVEIYALFVFYVGGIQSLRKSYHFFFRDAYANILFARTYRVKIACLMHKSPMIR